MDVITSILIYNSSTADCPMDVWWEIVYFHSMGLSLNCISVCVCVSLMFPALFVIVYGYPMFINPIDTILMVVCLTLVCCCSSFLHVCCLCLYIYHGRLRCRQDTGPWTGLRRYLMAAAGTFFWIVVVLPGS